MCAILRWRISDSASVRQAVSTRCRTKRGRLGSLAECVGSSNAPRLLLEIPELPTVSPPPIPGTPSCSSTAWSRLHGCRLEGCVSVAIRREHVGDQPHLKQPLVVSAEGLSPQQPCRLMFVHMWLFLITLLQICTPRGIHFHHKLLILLLIFDPGSQNRFN